MRTDSGVGVLVDGHGGAGFGWSGMGILPMVFNVGGSRAGRPCHFVTIAATRGGARLLRKRLRLLPPTVTAQQ